MDKELIEKYVAMDVGKICGEIAIADDKKLEDLIFAGMLKGHSNAVNEAFLRLNSRALESAGANEKEILSSELNHRRGDLNSYVAAFNQRGIVPTSPNRKVALNGLKNSVLNGRGTTIDDPNTSTGEFYRQAFGTNFINFSSIVYEINGEPKSYNQFGKKDQITLREIAINDLVDRELGRPSENKISYQMIEIIDSNFDVYEQLEPSPDSSTGNEYFPLDGIYT